MDALIPILIALLLLFSLAKGTDIYGAFIEGARSAFPMLIKMLPAMAAMLIAIRVMSASGALDAIFGFISPLFEKLGMPVELSPMLFLRPFSGSGAMSLLQDVLMQKGADSFEGIAASIMLGSTETVFYTIALYSGSIGLKKARGAALCAILTSLLGAALALIAARLIIAN